MANGWAELKEQRKAYFKEMSEAAAKNREESEQLHQKVLAEIQRRKDKELEECGYYGETNIDTPENFEESIRLEQEKEIEEGKAFHVFFKKEDFADKSESPFAKPNKYNYRINVNHPVINKAYMDFKKFIGVSMALSDKERMQFESCVLSKFISLGIRKEDYGGEEISKKDLEPRKKFYKNMER